VIGCDENVQKSGKVGLVLAPGQCLRAHGLERPFVFGQKQNVGCVPPHYSSDLAPFDSFLFTWMKQELTGGRCDEVAAVQRESLSALDSIPIEGFRKCFQQWEWRWDRRIQSKWEYFEGD
jgi:hypothetical protein